jgi:hypothetical protein
MKASGGILQGYRGARWLRGTQVDWEATSIGYEVIQIRWRERDSIGNETGIKRGQFPGIR